MPAMPIRMVDFAAMADGTREEYHILRAAEDANPVPIADHVLTLLKSIEGHNPGYRICRYQHSLQTATRAFRDEADEETVCVALLHDIGDMVAPENHSAFAAELLKPYVSGDNYWLVRHHGVFQGYYYFHHFDRDRDARERYRGHQRQGERLAMVRLEFPGSQIVPLVWSHSTELAWEPRQGFCPRA